MCDNPWCRQPAWLYPDPPKPQAGRRRELMELIARAEESYAWLMEPGQEGCMGTLQWRSLVDTATERLERLGAELKTLDEVG